MDRSIAVLEALIDGSGTTAERRLKIQAALSASQDKQDKQDICPISEEVQRVRVKLLRLPRSLL